MARPPGAYSVEERPTLRESLWVHSLGQKKMKIAITGGGGFLGRRLARALLADRRVERLVLADVAAAIGPQGDPTP
jgi:FlaA1/EpsC-like NDP-sugar epimerase